MKKAFLMIVMSCVAKGQLLQPSAREVLTKCAACHAGEKAPKGIKLDSFESVSLFVSAYAPEKSLIMQVLTGMGKPQMPPTYPLPWREINAVRRWIIGGADLNGYDSKMQMRSMGGQEK